MSSKLFRFFAFMVIFVMTFALASPALADKPDERTVHKYVGNPPRCIENTIPVQAPANGWKEGGCPEEPPACPTGQHRNDDGDCVPNEPPACPTGQHRNDDGDCVPNEPPACPTGQHRNDDGDCVPNDGSTSSGGTGGNVAVVATGKLYQHVTDGCEQSQVAYYSGTGEERVPVGEPVVYAWADGVIVENGEEGQWFDTTPFIGIYTWVRFDPLGDCAAKLVAEKEAERLALENLGLNDDLTSANGEIKTLNGQVDTLTGERDTALSSVETQNATLLVANACVENPLQWGAAKFADAAKASLVEVANDKPLLLVGIAFCWPWAALLIAGLIFLIARRRNATISKMKTAEVVEKK